MQVNIKKVTKHIPFISLLFFSLCSLGQQVQVTSGMHIQQSAEIRNAVYNLPAPVDTAAAVISITGDNLVIDFNGAELNGATAGQLPNSFAGIAVYIRNSNNVVIRNLKARGYKVALLASNVKGLIIEQCDFSYNYRQQLNSTQEKEDIADWMSYHHNDKDEWLRYGAAIYLRDCSYPQLKNNKVTGGQNGLMLTRCDHAIVYHNDFSFNSGIGIGLYRSSYNNFSFNRVRFNVRGYSHGVYNRGQDSAGFLVYEQSSHNVFYKNNATHSGDGFFLWAGQYTMDTGEGGCNDNIIRGNDFSYAPTNGIEVTFSRNTIASNRLIECDHGIWGGYSYSTAVYYNNFARNRIAIAIEHGQDNSIYKNYFSEDGEAIRLWARKQQPADWGYAQHRDTRSRDYLIFDNNIYKPGTGLRISLSDKLKIYNNQISQPGKFLDADSSVTNLSFTHPVDTSLKNPPLVDPMANSFLSYRDSLRVSDSFVRIPDTLLAGRNHILITEWGPYDYRYPIIWQTNPTDTGALLRFDLLGPAGSWKVIRFTGVEGLSAMSGTFPSVLTARKLKSWRTDIRIELEYTGAGGISIFGEPIPAGKPWAFRFRKFFQPVDWDVSWYAYDSLNNPIVNPEFLAVQDSLVPIKEENTDRIEYAWWGGIRAGDKQYTRFVTVANGAAKFPEGQYELSITWDDAVKLWVDGEPVLNELEPSKYTFDESPNRKMKVYLNGNHTFRLEHIELGGFATLSFKIRKID